MLDTFKSALVGQYEFALSMFEDCISQCPVGQWDEHIGNFPFWHVAFHALFYTDLYLSPDLESFEPPAFYRLLLDRHASYRDPLIGLSGSKLSHLPSGFDNRGRIPHA